VASPPPAPINSPAYSSKTNDTASTADSTADAYESFGREKNSEFVCWLSSQEFDSSDLVTTLQDAGACNDVNISVISNNPESLDAEVAEPISETASKKETLKDSRTLPANDAKGKQADTEEQSWWSISEVQALLDKLVDSDSCNWLSPSTLWQKEEVTPSAFTCQTAGLALLSTPLAGENYHMPSDNSMMSKASSHLFGEDIADPQQADPRKELLFTPNKQDYELCSTNDLVVESIASKAPEGSALGARNDKMWKRVKDKRRQRRSGQMSRIAEDFI
jgi:hypothetical protein